MEGKIEKVEKEQRILENAITACDYYQKETWYSVISNSVLLNGNQAKIWHEQGRFHFQITIVDDNIKPEDGKHLLSMHNLKLAFKDSFTEWHGDYDCISSIEASISPKGYMVIDGEFNDFCLSLAKDGQHESNYTALIECPDCNFLGHFFPSKHLEVGLSILGFKILCLSIYGENLNMFIFGKKNTNKQYLFIENITSTQFEKFKKIVNEIILSTTFLTGTFPGKEIIILANDNDEFYALCHYLYRENISTTQFSAIPSLFDHLPGHNNLLLNNGITFFEKMVERCISTPQYRRVILLLVKANSDEDYVKTTIYSVALESMSDLLYNENPVKPISEKKMAKELIGKLKEIILEYNNELPIESINKLSNYVQNINKPSNSDLLTKPFKDYGIMLNSENLAAIKNRNDFLHGRLPFDIGSHNLTIIACRLLFCVSCLVLKYVDYSGAVVYYSFHYQIWKNLPTEGEPYYLI